MIRKLLKKNRYRVKLYAITIFLLQQILFTSALYAQTISVTGKVVAQRYPVRNVSVTFIDNADTTRQFSTKTNDSGVYQIGLTTSIEADNNEIPAKFELGQSYPNPFSSSAAIPYGLNKPSNVGVTIYDILGRVVRKFDVGQQSIGVHNVLWDGRNNFGHRVATGIYLYRLNVDGQSLVKKMIFNQSGNSSVSLPGTFNFSVNKDQHQSMLKQNLQPGSYSIRIQNSADTRPVIVADEISNVVIANDTTINFSLTYIPVVDIDADSLHQVISGFGAANIILWRPDMTPGETETAFGNGDGQLGFSILRIMLEADSNRWSLYLPTAKKAQDLGATIIASPWFAPDYTSENVGNITRVRHDKYAEYAEHLNQFVKYMSDNGVDIYGVSIQNEPDIEENWTSWTSDEMFTFMKDYAHAIEGTKVMAPESFHFDRDYSDPILNDPIAEANTDIVCGHIYGSGLGQYPLAEEKGKEIWMTEHLSGENSTPYDWSWSLNAGEEINEVMDAGMNAYIWWYLVRYYGPISDGSYLRKGEVTKKGYVMSHFSKFIRPGYIRIESSLFPKSPAANVTAYKDPVTSKIIIVFTNSGTEELEQVIRFKNTQGNMTFTTYTTTETKNLEKGEDIIVTNGEISLTMEPSSIITYVSN